MPIVIQCVPKLVSPPSLFDSFFESGFLIYANLHWQLIRVSLALEPILFLTHRTSRQNGVVFAYTLLHSTPFTPPQKIITRYTKSLTIILNGHIGIVPNLAPSKHKLISNRIYSEELSISQIVCITEYNKRTILKIFSNIRIFDNIKAPPNKNSQP